MVLLPPAPQALLATCLITVNAAPLSPRASAQGQGEVSALGVAYANGLYVVAGYHGTRSPDGSGGLHVRNLPFIASSKDGRSWRRVSTPVDGNTNLPLSGISYAHDRFIATGARGTILVSRDAAHWALSQSGSAAYLNAAIYGQGKYVVVGAEGTILVSANAALWRRVNINYRGSIHDVAFGADRFVAVGEDPAPVHTSNDGEKWMPPFQGIVPTVSAITYGAGRFVAVGSQGIAAVSTDGVGWRGGKAGRYALTGIAFGKAEFVAVGVRPGNPDAQDAQIFTSSDGVSWTRRASGLEWGLSAIAYGHNGFVAVGEGGRVLLSSDGASWHQAGRLMYLARHIGDDRHW